jgi:hypothetical protein
LLWRIGRLRPTQQFRQRGEFRRHPPRFVLREQLGRRTPGLFLEIGDYSVQVSSRQFFGVKRPRPRRYGLGARLKGEGGGKIAMIEKARGSISNSQPSTLAGLHPDRLRPRNHDLHRNQGLDTEGLEQQVSLAIPSHGTLAADAPT